MVDMNPKPICSSPLATFGMALLAILPLLTGCIGVMPVPVVSTKPVYGIRLTHSEVAFIKPGQTSRDEVTAKLGTKFTSLPMNRAIAYSWEMKGGGHLWWAGYVLVPFPELSDLRTGYEPGGWRAFFVAFDERGVVTATAFKSPSTGRSLHEHMDRWLAKLPDSEKIVVASTRPKR